MRERVEKSDKCCLITKNNNIGCLSPWYTLSYYMRLYSTQPLARVRHTHVLCVRSCIMYTMHQLMLHCEKAITHGTCVVFVNSIQVYTQELMFTWCLRAV